MKELLCCVADVAREAADIVLMDDEFPSIVNAIEEGRVIYDNLKKTIAYTLAHAAPEVLPLFLNLVLNFPLGKCGGCHTSTLSDVSFLLAVQFSSIAGDGYQLYSG